jgi:hypothetical protein
MAITSIKTGSSFTNLVKYNDFLAGNTAFFPSSYESIASATGTGSSATITFSSIPSTYKHLQIRASYRNTTSGGGVAMEYNSDTGSNYTNHYLLGTGTAAQAYGFDTSFTPYTYLWGIGIGTSTTNPTVQIVDILDYTSTNKNKTIRALSGLDNNGTGNIVLSSSVWLNSTTAISTIKLTADYAFDTSSTFALYGIKG